MPSDGAFTTNMGNFSLHPLRVPEDIPLVHSWVTRIYAKFWGMAGFSCKEVEAAYVDITRDAEVYIGCYNDQPAFLLESYDPHHDPINEHYDVQPGDRGMHILVAPTETPIRHFTWSVFKVVMDFLFSDPTVQRIVVEPDIHNKKIHALNKRAGFKYQKIIQLNNKLAHLAFCSREGYFATKYFAAKEKESHIMNTLFATSPELAVSHLQPEVWAKVNRLHIRKAISEFAHEKLIEPELQLTEEGWGYYHLVTDKPHIAYRFRAQLLSLDHWHIDPGSIEKRVDDKLEQLDSLNFIVELHERLGIAPEMLPTYLEEIASTLYGSAYKHTRPGFSAEALTHASFQEVECAMMEGHPSFIANNGRMGFDAIDYRAYSPEAGSEVKLLWLAAHNSKAAFSCAQDLTYKALVEEELGTATLEGFASSLRQQGLNPDDYFLLPVHPWQWFNKLASLFSADIAARNLVCLGYGEDSYQAQQSIRTFFNNSQPHKRYVKTALSILNMGFMRGLSPDYMRNTPAINDWIGRLIDQDPYLSKTGFNILREVAAVGYRNELLDNATTKDSPYRKMLAALWRESPMPPLKQGQRLMTMASLLHIDAQNKALLPELIKSSGIDTATWLKNYLNCYLSPLLHCFYAHDLVFMPHGENLILVFENNVPVRAIMKDIAEESAILNTDILLSEKVQRLSVHVPEELKILSLFTDVFDGFFRYLAHILVEHGGYLEHKFWQQVADCVLAYQSTHPELAEKFEQYDLFAPEFIRSCLNRLQLGNNQQMVDLADPAKNLKFAGTLKNPIAEYKVTSPDKIMAELA